MMRLIFALSLSTVMLSCASLQAQRNQSALPKTSSESRMQNVSQKEGMAAASSLNGIPARNVGPTIMSGRVTDIDVNPNDPSQFYVAYASGGLWVTRNNGASFEPVADELPTLTIGDIAVVWGETEQLWVGSGENNSSRSSYAGMGLYFSPDGGETWQHKGLPESHHIGRISINPSTPSELCVAVMGHLYTPNKERGIYTSTDQGETWNQTLFVNEVTGAIDLVRDPLDSNHLFASTWEKSRAAWNFVEGGNGSGIWESIDNGATWKRITSENDFPEGSRCGRIGLSMYNGPKGLALYAMVDNQEHRPETEEADTNLTKLDFKDMDKAAFMQLDTLKLEGFLASNNFDEAYTATYLFEQISTEELEPIALYNYLYDANENLFDTPVIGPEVYRYEEVFGNWKRTHEDFLDDVCYSYGYYFGMLRVHPKNPKKLYIAGVPIITSDDGGATWKSIQQANQHVDHHSLWINPNRDGHIINGNDGGINISYDDGETYFKCNSPAVGQFYTVQVDNATPYNVYGGLQDNGVWVGPSDYEASVRWHQSGRYPYEELMGGDGMQIEVDTRTNQTVYTGYQFGHYYRINRTTGEQLYIHPKHELGEFPLRWNWQTPIHLSKFNQDILYMASNRFHRSMDAGETWETLSEDLTSGAVPGDVPFGTSTSIDESPLQFGKLIVGTDDGHVWKSSDAGQTWTEISNGLPANYWISRVAYSAHEEDVLYVTLNGYRTDDFASLLYTSSNDGQTWERLGIDIPNEPINVVLEDPLYAELLFVGTDNGLYISVDAGLSFDLYQNDFPSVAVHDLVIQEREEDLVIGTHGRSIYILPLTHLHLGLAQESNDLLVFETETINHNGSWGSAWSKWVDVWEPETSVAIFNPEKGTATLEITYNEQVIHKEEVSLNKGVNYIDYDLAIDPEAVEEFNQTKATEENAGSAVADNEKHYLPVGSYTVTINKEGKSSSTTLVIE
ncbi:MAG: glycosyl hydrolase [Flavobacteriales bacterium]|nr:glycosyl hydrolase [Flavobacteriales bacterium]